MKTEWNGSREAAFAALVTRLESAGWPRSEAFGHVQDIVDRSEARVWVDGGGVLRVSGEAITLE